MAHPRIWWTVAWRNLWRHPRRTIITALALALGFVFSVLIIGISDGIVAEMVENGTRVFTGHVQIHAAEFQPERSLYETIGGPDGMSVDDLLVAAEESSLVVAAAPRVYGGGLVAAGEETLAGILVGMDFQREGEVTRLLEGLAAGRLPTPGAGELLLGSEMARQLGVEVGSEIILVAPAADGSLGNDLFTLVGIIRTGLTAMDATHGYLPVADLQHLLALEPTRIHEVALRVTGPWDAPAAAEALTASLGDRFGPLAVEPWTEFRAELREYAILAESFNGVIVVIVFGMAVFGVANTMLMATYERRREFAVVRALGTPSRNVALTVVLEGLTLGIVSLAVGALVAFPLMVWWHNSPPDLGSIFGDFTMAGSLVRPILRVDYSTDGPVLSAIALLLTGVLAAAYPALRAVRIPPADALSGR